jgi:hypothetical protein
MSPRECLLDRIESLRDEAARDKPDGDRVNKLLADIRVYFAGVGATHCPAARQEGVSPGTRAQAESVYR